MIKRIISLALAALLLAFALLMLVSTFALSLEWIRIHINLAEALFDGRFQNAFRTSFAYRGIALEGRGFGAFANYVYYNAELLIKFVIAGISTCGGLLIALPVLKKKEN